MADDAGVLTKDDIVNALANIVHEKMLEVADSAGPDGAGLEDRMKKAIEIKDEDAYAALPELLNLLAPEVPADKRTAKALKETFGKDYAELLENAKELAHLMFEQDLAAGEEEEGEETEEAEENDKKRAGDDNAPDAKRKRD